MNNALTFFEKLAFDAATLRAFFGNPQAVMQQFNLTSAEQAMILAGQTEKIQAHVNPDQAIAPCLIFVLPPLSDASFDFHYSCP